MEGMNGIELAKENRTVKGNSVLIIMMTEYALYKIATREEIASIVDSVFMKPFSLKILYESISKYKERFL